MKSALTVLASVVLALLATWYAIADRVKMLARAPEQATVLVLPDEGGTCVPRVLRPVMRAHMDDTIEWRSVDLPGCEGQGAFRIEAEEEGVRLFDPPLRSEEASRDQSARVRHDATAGVTVTYTVELSGGQRDTARIVFF